jgi:hypothetical protein
LAASSEDTVAGVQLVAVTAQFWASAKEVASAAFCSSRRSNMIEPTSTLRASIPMTAPRSEVRDRSLEERFNRRISSPLST